MKLCLTNISFKKLSFLNFIREVKKIGIKNVELAPGLIYKNPYSDKSIKNIKKILKKNKIKVLSLQSLFFNCKSLNFKNYKDREYLVSYFKKIIKFAKALSIKQISIGSCPSRKSSKNKKYLYDLNYFFLKKFSIIAKNNNILLCLEPMSKKYGNFFLNNPNEVLKFIEKIKENNLKLLLDAGNVKTEKMNFKKICSKHKNKIQHIQLSNGNLNQIDMNFIKKSIIFLKRINYNKTVSIEYLSNKGKKLDQQKIFVKKI
tara:strand:- start:2038 stop:2814 length:777 start_codon:yes stop_codon:yes gene_type:complete